MTNPIFLPDPIAKSVILYDTPLDRIIIKLQRGEMSCKDFNISTSTFCFPFGQFDVNTEIYLLWVSLELADIFLMSPSCRGNVMIKWEYFTIGKTQSINKLNDLKIFLGKTHNVESASSQYLLMTERLMMVWWGCWTNQSTATRYLANQKTVSGMSDQTPKLIQICHN